MRPLRQGYPRRYQREAGPDHRLRRHDGRATGPHLHYEFQVNGRHVDRLSAKLPMADPLGGADRKRFMAQTQPMIARMDQEKKTLLALNKQR